MTNSYNDRVRQLLLLAVIIGLAWLLFNELYSFFPGFLGALTLYILSRDSYLFLVEQRGWKKNATASLFLVAFLVCLGLPVYLSIHLLSPKVNILFNNSQEIWQVLKSFSAQIRDLTGRDLLTDDTIQRLQQGVTGFIPTLLNSTASMLGNLIMILFLSFFMLTGGNRMEKTLRRFIPLRQDSIVSLAAETKNMVRANAIGIPLISIIQGLVAILGYWIFGIKGYILWGFMTGLFAFFPVLGTMVIWVPLVAFLFSSGHNGQAIGLAIYSIVVTGNIDSVARITLLKRIGNVHPVITILGLIAGLKLFGFWGFIFGPLLISYFLLLFTIYSAEFGSFRDPDPVSPNPDAVSGPDDHPAPGDYV